MSRCVYQTTLEKKLNKWKKFIKLSDWNIQIRYATKTDIDNEEDINLENDLASLITCSPPEKIARILINKNYVKDPDFGKVWNIDTLILHELIHILLYKEIEALYNVVKNRRSINKLEEFVCNSMARIVYDIIHRRSLKK